MAATVINNGAAQVKITGGEKLGQYLKKIASIKAEMRVGFFENAKYPDGTSVAYVAYLNEYGGHNPPRPFMKKTARKNIKKWVKGIAYNIKRSKLSQAGVRRAYTMAGIVAVGDVKRTIADWNPSDPRPNAESTIKAKARRGRNGANLEAIDPTRALIDSGQMIASVEYEVNG